MSKLSKKAADILVEFINARSEAKELSDHAATLQPELVEHIEGTGNESASVVRNGHRYTGTVVRGTSYKLDTEKLKKRIGAKTWTKVTKRVLDDKKLEDAVAKGLISEHDVAICTEEVEKSPYVRGNVKPTKE